MAHVAKYQASAIGNMTRHYDRSNRNERPNIDRALSHRNYNLAPRRENGSIEFISERIKSLDLKRTPRKDAVRMCDCVITLPKSFPIARSDEFFFAAYEYLSAKFGKENVISSWVHMDETTPHMHFAWVPITEDGRLSAKDVVSRQVLSNLHSDLQVSMEKMLGCKVEILLDDTKQGEKQLSHLSHDEYKTAKNELESVREELTQSRSEAAEIASQRDSALREVSELRGEVSRLKTALNTFGERFRELTQYVAEIADTMKFRPFLGQWKRALENLTHNPIARAAVCAGQPFETEKDARRADKIIKTEVKETRSRLRELQNEMSMSAQQYNSHERPAQSRKPDAR